MAHVASRRRFTSSSNATLKSRAAVNGVGSIARYFRSDLETKTLACLYFAGCDLEFVLYVDQDRGAGDRSNHVGCLSCSFWAFIWPHGHPHPTRATAAQPEGMVSAFDSRGYKC